MNRVHRIVAILTVLAAMVLAAVIVPVAGQSLEGETCLEWEENVWPRISETMQRLLFDFQFIRGSESPLMPDLQAALVGFINSLNNIATSCGQEQPSLAIAKTELGEALVEAEQSLQCELPERMLVQHQFLSDVDEVGDAYVALIFCGHPDLLEGDNESS